MSAEREQRRAPQAEAEARTERAAGNHEEEEDRLDAGGSCSERTDCGAEGRQHAEQRQRLGVEAAFGKLRQHDCEHEQQERAEDDGRDGARADTRSGADEERPGERDEPERRRDRERSDGAWADANRAHEIAPAKTPATRTCSTVSHGRGARIFAT